MSALSQETVPYGFHGDKDLVKEETATPRAPKVTQQEAAFLLARGPYVARVAAQEKLLAYLYSITPKAGELGPKLPEYVEQDLLESLAAARENLEQFDASQGLADVIEITPNVESTARQEAEQTAGQKVVALTVKVSHELPLLDDGTTKKGDWRIAALCAQTDQEAFFPEKGGSTREAKKVCLTCEVREECLEYALGNDERHGIWGGLSERERRKLKKRAV